MSHKAAKRQRKLDKINFHDERVRLTEEAMTSAAPEKPQAPLRASPISNRLRMAALMAMFSSAQR